ncbi:hypothetical protein A4A49_14693 [Nicotiana attenuata]|uniref:Uncharacterized protein n=1 Tax=Nicotiana attenuata TaxID=49451 RepID=A0A1J6J2Q1_NICAT|nr:hypothetical protein A4A49_14693 [Nicotiana attenuata]
MAGLQYNFFPTDLLYPLQKTNREINISQQSNLLIKTRKNSDESLDDSISQNKSINNNNKTTTIKAISSSSSSFALAPIPKNKKDQDQDQVN